MRYLLAIIVALAAIRPAVADVIASTLRANVSGSAAHLTLAWAAPASVSLAIDRRTARLRLSRPLAGDIGAVHATLSRWLTSLRRDGRSGELTIGLQAGVHAALAAQSANTYVLTLTRGLASDGSTDTGPRQSGARGRDRPASRSQSPPPLASISPAAGPLLAEGQPEAAPTLRFTRRRQTPAVVFEHANVVWMVFGAGRQDLAAL